MSSWLLPLFLFATWFVWIVACSAEKAVDEARRGVQENQRGGVSIVPGIPLFPLAFWGIALLADFIIDPWGTWVIGLAHAAFLVLLLSSIVRNWLRLRTLSKKSKVNRPTSGRT
jgi:uncharacterized membrane protein YcjF (UPF0283 family)